MLHPPRRGQPQCTRAFVIKHSQLPLALTFSSPPESGLWTNTTALCRLQQSRSCMHIAVMPIMRPERIHVGSWVRPFLSMAN